ncbi:MAG: amidohydrolase [Candidatus Marinimicrobia bacterium]|nr:amidohydrolase [Candidatus Neomarinimicrobiota bacterium]
MKKIKVSQIQFQAKSTPLENCYQLESLYKKTLKFKPDLICTPECSNIITNDKKYLFNYTNFQRDCPILHMSKKFAKKNKIFINIGSLLLKKEKQKKLINRSFLINRYGKIQMFYDKIHMFDVKINSQETHKESESFKAGNKIVTSKINNIKFGFTICYDLRFPNLFRKLSKKGSDVILVPSAFTVPTGKDHWEILLRARAIENNTFIIATNMCGRHHTNRKTYGHSLLINPWGKIVNKALKKPKIINSNINISEVEEARKKIPSLIYD